MDKVIVVENLQKVYKPKSRKQSVEVKAVDGIDVQRDPVAVKRRIGV